MSARPPVVAAVDCGTNSTRLLVEGPDGVVLARRMEITRLGQGVDATRTLDPGAVERTVAVLARFRREMDRHHVGAARMAATSAVRDAANGQSFLDAATATLGIPAEVLSGEEEGSLAFAGATADLRPGTGDVVVLDIGGGSTELVVGTPSGGRPDAVSLDIGCVRLTERCFPHDPPTAGELDEARRVVNAQLDVAMAAVPALADLGARAGKGRLVGLAGTVSTLAMLDLGLAEYDWGRVHHATLSLDAVERWMGALSAEPAAARARRSGMVPGREDVIVGGVLVLEAVMRRMGFDRCLVSERDILDGLAASLRLRD